MLGNFNYIAMALLTYCQKVCRPLVVVAGAGHPAVPPVCFWKRLDKQTQKTTQRIRGGSGGVGGRIHLYIRGGGKGHDYDMLEKRGETTP